MYSSRVSEPYRALRCLINQILTQVMLRGKKKTAPYLKQLLPSWYAALRDPATECSKAAEAAFAAAFADEQKRKNVLLFAHDAILAAYTETVAHATKEAFLADAKGMQSDEATEKYSWTVYTTLSALRALLSTSSIQCAFYFLRD